MSTPTTTSGRCYARLVLKLMSMRRWMWIQRSRVDSWRVRHRRRHHHQRRRPCRRTATSIFNIQCAHALISILILVSTSTSISWGFGNALSSPAYLTFCSLRSPLSVFRSEHYVTGVTHWHSHSRVSPHKQRSRSIPCTMYTIHTHARHIPPSPSRIHTQAGSIISII